MAEKEEGEDKQMWRRSPGARHSSPVWPGQGKSQEWERMKFCPVSEFREGNAKARALAGLPSWKNGHLVSKSHSLLG